MATAQRMNQTQPKRAAIYVRVSSKDQEENYSLPTQEEACREYCEQQGYSVVDVFRDVHTGAELWERRGLSSAREAARTGVVDVIVAFSVDRLSRSQQHRGALLTEADRYGATYEFATEKLDDTLEGRILLGALGMAAEVERELFRERSLRGKRARITSGKPLHGQRPLYGYRWNDDKSAYLVNEAEAAIVCRVFTEVANGRTLRSIKKSFDEEGVPLPLASRKGIDRWQTSTVQRICKQPAYWGEAVANRYHVEKVRVRDKFSDETRVIKRRYERPESERVDVSGAVPALVSKVLATACAARLAHNREVTRAANLARDPENALLRGGFIRCGYCGCNFVVMYTGGSRVPRYRCGSKGHDIPGCGWHVISAGKLDPIVWAQIERVLTQPDVIAAEVEKLRTDDPTAADLAMLDARIAEIAKQQANLARVAAMLDDADAIAPLAAQLETLAESKRKLTDDRQDVLARQDAWQAAQHRLDDLRGWCETVASHVTSLTYTQKRDALYALGVRVTMYRQDHDPRYTVEANVPLGSSEHDPHQN